MERDDLQELRELVYRYAQGVDRRDYALLESLFTEDAALRIFSGDVETGKLRNDVLGRDAILRAMRHIERYERTTHFVANHLVELEGDRATGETYCQASHIHRVDGVHTNSGMSIRYRDRYVRVKGRWRFAERCLQVDWEDDVPVREA